LPGNYNERLWAQCIHAIYPGDIENLCAVDVVISYRGS